MKIALFCTNEFALPLRRDIIHAPMFLFESLVEELADRGHEVFVYASDNSSFKNKNIRLVSKDLTSFDKAGFKNMWGSFHDQEAVTVYEQFLMSKMLEDEKNSGFDIIHLYHQITHFLPFVEFAKTPIVATLHDPLNDKRKFLLENCKARNKVNYVSISYNQRKDFPSLNYQNTIYNGLDEKTYNYIENPEDYFVFLGRISPEKGPHIAVKVARETGIKLKIIGPKWNADYFKNEIEPYINKEIEYLGAMEQEKTRDIVSKAKALLFPIQWEEPFGLVMIEALAGGVPVIAFDRGSVREIIENEANGFAVESEKEMKEAIGKIEKIERKNCRKIIEEKFTIKKMTEDYENLYNKLANKK